jgi:RNA polymerase sigma factor (sigma-70 family)
LDKKRILKEYYALEYDNLAKKIGRRVFDAQDIDDVLQEAFTKALEYLDSFKGDRPFPNWFGVILQNTVKDYRTEFLNNKAGLSHNDAEELDEDNFPIPG